MLEIKKYAMIIGITILFTTLVFVTIDAFYTKPTYETFCGRGGMYPAKPYPIMAPSNCTEIIFPNQDSIECEKKGGYLEYSYDNKGCQVLPAKCNTCQKEYEGAQKLYNRNVFYISAPIGLAAILLGIFWTIDFLGSGFMFGGIAVLSIGTIAYFSSMNKYLRVLVILFELLLFIWIGYKKLVTNEEKRKKQF